MLESVGTTAYAGGKMLAARDGGIGLITFNQPEKRNAMAMEMWLGLGEILTEFEADDTISVVVLSGAGDKAFVSGADISQFEKNRHNADAQKEYDRVTGIGREKFHNFGKPIIARIRGFCMGGGLAIAMATDLRIGTPDSQFGIPAARLSVAYAADSVKRLIDLVGPAHARMILYSARRIDGREAERIGLINQCVPADELDEAVMSLARTISENAPLSVRASKMTINEMLKDESQRNMAALKEIGEICFNSADYKEGRTAFMGKAGTAVPGEVTGSAACAYGGLAMSVALTPENDRLFSREEYRRWCENQVSGRYERVDGRIVAMAPERGAHIRVKSKVWLALRNAVMAAGVPCQALPDGATIETGESDYEPDALVNCGPPMDDDAIAAPNPVVVVEVLSPGTRSVDTGGKLVDYFQVASVSHYLVVHPTRRVVTHHRRTLDGIETRIILNGSIVMQPPGISITVEEIFTAD